MTKTKDIRHTVRIAASPHAIYDALMDSRKHTKFTGAPAKIGRKVGDAFTAHGEHLSGINVELVKDCRIVQAWRADGWPDGHYSIASFELKPVRNGTVLSFTQTGVPTARYKSINNGWKHYYWEPLKQALEK